MDRKNFLFAPDFDAQKKEGIMKKMKVWAPYLVALCAVVPLLIIMSYAGSAGEEMGTQSTATSQPASDPILQGTKPKKGSLSITAWPGIPDDANPFPDWPTPPTSFAFGDDRVEMTQQQLEDRKHAMIVTRTFVLLKKPLMVSSAQKVIKEYFDLVAEAANDNGLDPWILLAILWVESQGNAEAQSSTGPRGIMQFAGDTARDVGLRVDKKCTTWRRMKGKSLPPVKCTPGEDERLDPKKAIPAAAKHLKSLKDLYGSVDFAIAAYHMGTGNTNKLIRTFIEPAYDEGKSIEENIKSVEISIGSGNKQKGIYYADIYFRNTPYRNPNTFALIQKIDKRDEGPTYYFRIYCAMLLLKFAKDNPNGFKKLAEEHEKYNGETAKYRFWTWYKPSELKKFGAMSSMAKLEKDGREFGRKALKKAKEDGVLVGVKNDKKYGYELWLKGRNAIAQVDLESQETYLVLDPETNALLQLIGKTMQGLGDDIYIPKVTSLTRSAWYQEELKEDNGNAHTALPMHTVGKAFDFWDYDGYTTKTQNIKNKKGKVIGSKEVLSAKSIPADGDRDLEFVLEEMDGVFLSYTTQEPGCRHVVRAPELVLAK